MEPNKPSWLKALMYPRTTYVQEISRSWAQYSKQVTTSWSTFLLSSLYSMLA
jgi:hypothetical protein